MTLSGCAGMGVVAEPPLHCSEKDEWHDYLRVAHDKVEVFAVDDEGYATRFLPLAGRIDYLEAHCASINAYRGDGSSD